MMGILTPTFSWSMNRAFLLSFASQSSLMGDYQQSGWESGKPTSAWGIPCLVTVCVFTPNYGWHVHIICIKAHEALKLTVNPLGVRKEAPSSVKLCSAKSISVLPAFLSVLSRHNHMFS
jgi:hypothetical protein